MHPVGEGATTMKAMNGFCRVLMALPLVAILSTLVRAFPVRVQANASGPQSVNMCWDCSRSGACVGVGDYKVDLSADIEHPKNGGVVRFTARLADRQGLPVMNTRVLLVLSTVGSEREPRVLRMPGGSG